MFHQRTTFSADTRPSTRPATLKCAVILLAAMCASTGALAHTGADAASHHALHMLSGLAHPFGGLDHLAAMLAVGFWSAIASRRIWVAPLAFANMLLVGALLGMSGIAFPAVEPLIAASVLVLGLLLATRAKLPTMVSATLAGGFAVFHGMAHGAELAGNAWLAPLLGMVIGTVALHLAGVGAGLALRGHSAWWARGAGAAVALTGSVLLVQAL